MSNCSFADVSRRSLQGSHMSSHTKKQQQATFASNNIVATFTLSNHHLTTLIQQPKASFEDIKTWVAGDLIWILDAQCQDRFKQPDDHLFFLLSLSVVLFSFSIFIVPSSHSNKSTTWHVSPFSQLTAAFTSTPLHRPRCKCPAVGTSPSIFGYDVWPIKQAIFTWQSWKLGSLPMLQEET